MIQDFLSAIKKYFQAWRLIQKLNLWRYFFIPALISLLVAVLLSFAIYGWSDNIGRFLAQVYPFSYGKDWVTSLAEVIGALLILGIGLVLYKHIVMALAAPFMAPLSEKVEEYITGTKSKEFSNVDSLIRGIRINTRNLIFELLIVIPCTLLSFIPVVGLVFTIISFATQAYYAGFGNIDYTLERHLNYRNSLNFVKQNRFTAIGNGTLYTLFLLVPFVGIILVLPVATVAATISTIDKLKIKPKDLYV